jgi:hypothetical protein
MGQSNGGVWPFHDPDSQGAPGDFTPVEVGRNAFRVGDTPANADAADGRRRVALPVALGLGE